MNTNFIYHAPTKVYFGENKLSNLGFEIRQFGNKVLLVYGEGSIKKIGLYDKVLNELNNAGMTIFELAGVEPNPNYTSLNDGAAICKKENVDVILAVGGGSTIDASKGIASATFYDGDAWDLCNGTAKTDKFLPIVAVLTLVATGSEMDGGAVISNKATHEKKGLGADGLKPKVAFLDPTVTYSVNKFQTACGSVDIMSHLFDTAYFAFDNDMELLNSFMEAQLRTIIKYAPIAQKEPDNYDARANLMWASSLALNGLMQGGKQVAPCCHWMEHELSAYYDITHGLGLAIITPRWMKYVLNEKTAPKFYRFGVNVFGIDPSLDEMTVAEKSIEMLSDFFFKTLGLQSTLEELGIDEQHFDVMAESACFGDVLNGIVPLNKEDIIKIYKMCL
ncbi:MAG: iron-containing alcohol dehydrogenase [Draconibacterium sp.]